MHDLLQDLRLGARSALGKPAFTAAAVLTLALAIGANTAVFSVLYGVVLRPLPYADPERLDRLWLENPHNRFGLSVADFLYLREAATSFEDLAGFRPGRATLTGRGAPRRLAVQQVTAGYFATLGVEPALGRAFRRGEDEPGAEPVVIVSDRFWHESLGGSADVLGTALDLDGRPHTVIGVLSPEARPLVPATEVWTTLHLAEPGRRGPFFLRTLARRHPGVSAARAQAELEVLTGRIFERWSSTFSDRNVRYLLQPLQASIVGDMGRTLWLLFGAVLSLLWIATANIAGLLVARAGERRREFALRAALGAGRARLARQLVTEGAWLAALGGGAGLLLALWGLDVLRTLFAGDLPRAAEIRLDARVLAFTAAATAASTLLFSLAPLAHKLGGGLAGALRGGAAELGTRRLRGALVVLELAVALPLLMGAGLFLRTFHELGRVDPGYDPASTLTVSLSLPPARYPTGTEVRAFYRDLVERARALPGVTAAGLAMSRPPAGVRESTNFSVADRPVPAGESEPIAHWVAVDPGFFTALDIPLLEGRAFDDDDGDGAPPVVVIDRTLARQHFADRDPVGQRLRIGGASTAVPVVGVVGSARHRDLAHDEPTIYVPHAQDTRSEMYLFLRGAGSTASLLPAVRQLVAGLDVELAVAEARTLEGLIADATSEPRTRSLLVAIFASLAVALAAIGVYGTLSYLVSRSHREIGIRMALGAGSGGVRRLVLRRGLGLATLGVALGLAATPVLTGFAEGLLYGVSPTDPATLAGVVLLLLGVAALASYLPSRHATRVDPTVVLRDE